MDIDRRTDIELHNHYSIADNYTYESLSRRTLEDEFRSVLVKLLPAEWNTQPDGFWLHAGPAVELPNRAWVQQGYKIHVSCTPSDVEIVLRVVVPILVGHQTPFKIVGDAFLFHLQNSKHISRGNSGKFLTVFPPDETVFRKLIEHIYQQLRRRNIDGPRILSDRKYKPGAPVYYRYGSFIGRTRLTSDGFQTPVLDSPAGESMPDLRLPIWRQPHWEQDLFEEMDDENVESDDVILASRYRIDSAISFTNSGGIYIAIDQHNGTQVIVKEARPYTNFWTVFNEVLDARDLLRHEHTVLLRLRQETCVPDALDLVEDAGHLFLIMEFVNGESLDHLVASDSAIAGPYLHQANVRIRFESLLQKVGTALITAVSNVHQAGVLLGDISPGNVFYDATNHSVHLIDFESAYLSDSSELLTAVSTHWATAGFGNVERTTQKTLTPKDDWFAVGRLLLFLAVPIAPLFHLCPEAEERIWEHLGICGLPNWLRRACQSLQNGKPDEAAALLDHSNCPPYQHTEYLSEKPPQPMEPMLKDIVNGIANALRHSCSPNRDDRLWPAHYLVYITNPLSISHGACGPILFFADTGRTPPLEATRWLASREDIENSLPPGVFVGLAGVAYTWARLGQVKQVIRTLSMLKRSPLLFSNPTLEVGVAGWGLACLRIHALTKLDEARELADQAAQYLLNAAQETDGLATWQTPEDDRVHYGFARGSTGVALFLLNYAATNGNGNLTAYRLGQAALDFDLNHKVDTPFGWQWRRVEGENMVLPYHFAGSAGIGAVCIRAYALHGDKRFLDIARRIADDCYLTFAYSPGLDDGLAGIGEFLLDVFRETGEAEYHRRALEIARAIMVFRIEQSEGIRFPGRWLTRMSDDYATGSAGIGCFLDRLLQPRPRLILDV